MTSHRATFYIQLKATRRSYGNRDEFGQRPIESIRAVAMTQKRPERPQAQSVVAKLTVEIPAEAFDPFSPAATIVIPEGLLAREAMVVEASETEPLLPPEEDKST